MYTIYTYCNIISNMSEKLTFGGNPGALLALSSPLDARISRNQSARFFYANRTYCRERIQNCLQNKTKLTHHLTFKNLYKQNYYTSFVRFILWSVNFAQACIYNYCSISALLIRFAIKIVHLPTRLLNFYDSSCLIQI